jgi:hypothetical protein
MARGTRGSGAKSGSNFLSNFFRKKRETNVEPAYKPEPGVMYGQLPADYKQTEAEQFRKSRAFQIANTGRTETNRQRLETNLAFDRDSPTRQQERQLKAKTGEALLAEAVAKQATSAAQIGGLGTARTFGRGSTSIT